MLSLTSRNLYKLHNSRGSDGCGLQFPPEASSLFPCPCKDCQCVYSVKWLMVVFVGVQHSVWLDDAFDRARQLYLSYYRSIPKSLERSTAHKLMLAMLDGDERFVEPTPKSLQNLTLQSVKNAVMNQFVGRNMEVHSYLPLDLFFMNISGGRTSYEHCISNPVKVACVHCTGQYCWGLLGGGD